MEEQKTLLPSAASPRVMVAMSGGVDSAVTALLMKQAGYDVTGAMMRLYREGDPLPTGAPLSEDTPDITEARRVAQIIGIPFEVCHLEAEFCRLVVDPFAEAYLRGETPNPCVICNRQIKFGQFLRWALDRGLSTMATGHYARVTRNANGRMLVQRAVDASKDQTYMFWSLHPDVLSHLVLPLGRLTKQEVRQIATEAHLSNARKKDSQDICFIPDGDYAGFLRRYTGISPIPGPFVGTDGQRLGEHRGILHYTIGQRKGLGIAWREPLYVASKNAISNEVTLCRDRELYHSALDARDCNWIPFDRLDGSLHCQAKIRYQHSFAPATVWQTSDSRIHVVFDQPQRAIAGGQSVVLYDGDTLLGGGIIESFADA